MSHIKASIIICTYNRSSLLKQALASVSTQSVSSDRFEIVVVDNNSTDDTARVVSEASAISSVPILHLVEKKQGLSHARNRGIEAARGEIIAFIDDDAVAYSKDWLQKLMEIFNEPAVACVGGKVMPDWQNNSGPPEWLHERLFCFFSIVDYPSAKKLRYPDYPAGTNMAFRKTVLAALGGFNAKLGRTGTSLLSGEDTDLCLRIEMAGHDIRYTPDAAVYHNVHEGRLTKKWVRDRSHWQGVSAAFIERIYFSPFKIGLKMLKYAVFIAAGLMGKFLFTRINREKPAFFCECQTILCKAYLNGIVRRKGAPLTQAN